MATRIKDILKEKRMTQQDLACLLGCSLQNVKQTLNKPSLTTETLEKIAQALNVPLWQLFASPEEATCSVNGDFVAFVRNAGHNFTFTDKKELREFVDRLI